MNDNLPKSSNENSLVNYTKSDDILSDMCGIIESSQNSAYKAVNTLLVRRNWLIGYRIAEEEIGKADKPEYGLYIIKNLSKKLTEILSWSHYRILIQVKDKTARDWYAKEAEEQTWSGRTLQRNVSSQYYYRLQQKEQETNQHTHKEDKK